jgi:Protein phosphatase 2C
MTSAPWRIVRASVIGPSHIKAGAPCQDYSLHELIDCAASEPVLVAVISDGAGSQNRLPLAHSLLATPSFRMFVRS